MGSMLPLDSKSRGFFLARAWRTPATFTEHGWSIDCESNDTLVDQRDSGTLRAGQQMFHDCRHHGRAYSIAQ
jgi:hypothetical protein